MIVNRRSWLKVWFSSGHTLGEQSIFGVRFRDMAFHHTWADFKNFDVSKEKPEPLEVACIGTQDSLFCWVRQQWRRDLTAPAAAVGWLACNDGSMEIADFIHFDIVAGVPELTLIHVKASGNTRINRPLAISDYEIVTSQAVKNLRFLDLQNTVAEFCQFLSTRLMNAVWHAGAVSTRAAMFAAMQACGTNFHRRIVIVQPRTTKTALDAARAATTGRSKRIAQQLDALLLGAPASCQSLGADFVVIRE